MLCSKIRVFLLKPLVAVSCLLVACGKNEQTNYKIPKEEIQFTVPSIQASSPGGEMAKGKVPVATDSDLPDWNPPSHWVAGKTSNIRKGSFSYQENSGSKLEVSVTVFPGDVGGLLANINRWAGQISLPPYTESDLKNITETKTVHSTLATIVRLNNPSQQKSIIAAIFKNNGNSWFVKASGDQSAIFSQNTSIQSFIDSIQFN